MAASDIIIKCEEFIDSEENIEDINQTFFNDYDEHRHDSEPENNENRKMDSECENDDIKLQEILQEFDLEILFTLLKFSDITYRSLLYISENDINTAIRSIAYRAEFREKLFAWRRDKYNLNDVSVLPPPKQSSMPLGVNNSHNIPLSNTNTNRDSNSPMNTTTSTKPSSGLTAPRAKRTLSPKTSAAKKSRTTSQAASDSRVSVSSPTRTSSSEALSISQHGTKTRPSIDFDKPLCFKPTTSSAAAAATTSSMTPITDSFLSEPPTEYAEFIQAPSEVSLLGEPQPKTTIGKQDFHNMRKRLEVDATKNISSPYQTNLSYNDSSSTKREIVSKDLTVEEILSRTQQGKALLHIYEKEKMLTPEQRTVLVHQVIQHFVENGKQISVQQCKNLGEQIVSIFPTECVDTYFVQVTKKTPPKGKLWDRYHGQKRNLKKSNPLTERKRKISIDLNAIPTTTDHREQLEKIHCELKDFNMFKWNEILEKWKKTILYRKLHLQYYTPQEILYYWPLFKEIRAPELVDIDYANLYPDQNLNFSKWLKFCEVAVVALKDRIKDLISINYLKRVFKDRNNIDTDNLNICYIKLLHAILPPLSNFVDGRRVKFSIVDSQNAFTLPVALASDVDTLIAGNGSECYHAKALRPLIVVVGNEFFYENFFVVLGDTKYSFATYLEALQFCFKLMFVLNIKYPIECCNVWLFIQKFLFNKPSKEHPKVDTFVNDINNIIDAYTK